MFVLFCWGFLSSGDRGWGVGCWSTGHKARDSLANKLTYTCMRHGDPELMHKAIDLLQVTGNTVVSGAIVHQSDGWVPCWERLAFATACNSRALCSFC